MDAARVNIPVTVVDATWTSRSVQVYDADGLFDELRRLGEAHLQRVRKLSVNWSAEEVAADVGFAVEMSGAAGESLFVGVHRMGWLVYRTQPGPVTKLPGDLSGSTYVAFLMPEWTEVEQGRLMSEERASKVLRHWIEGGNINL